jgi:hypothetical protein
VDHVLEVVQQRAEVSDAGDQVRLALDQVPVPVDADVAQHLVGRQTRPGRQRRDDAGEVLVGIVPQRGVHPVEARDTERLVPGVLGDGLVDHVLGDVEQHTFHSAEIGTTGRSLKVCARCRSAASLRAGSAQNETCGGALDASGAS